MSKRFFAQQYGDRKKAKLDITISDHNFPLSQNVGVNNDANKWGDDNDDEILLMASQACEEVYGNNSTLPDFSLCMQPGATSTQMFPQPGTSKAEFHFKKPTINSPQLTSTQLKDKCNRISSPLPGMTSKISNVQQTMKYNDDFIYNDKVYKGQDTDHVYRQLLQLQEENAKLKSENGKLLDKCVTREGEASILRTQLKSCQVAVDNARMEKIRAQEKVQMEWTEKLSAVSGKMTDLRTQLDFKNLEIISIKEKCKMLQSAKVKLTQVTVPNNDITSSPRHKNTCSNSMYQKTLSQRRANVASVGAQTDGRAHFLKLNKSHVSAPSKLPKILPLILEPTCEEPSLLDCNEKLRTSTDQLQHNCRIFSTFHRIPSTPAVTKLKNEYKMTINCIHEDLTRLADVSDGTNVEENLEKLLKTSMAVLMEVQSRLRAVSERATTAFQRDMEARGVAAGRLLPAPASPARLLAGRALYKDEQEILARRVVAMLAYIFDSSNNILTKEQIETQMATVEGGLLPLISDICTLLDITSCATLYTGLLCSVTRLIRALPAGALLAGVVRGAIACRAGPLAARGLLAALRGAAGAARCSGAANVKVDYEQGVLLFRKDSCHLLVLLKQVEVALKCMEKQNLVEEALATTQNLLGFYANYSKHHDLDQENKRCDCQLVLMQVIVYALRICSDMMVNCNSTADGRQLARRLVCACRAGVVLLHGRAARDLELGARLGLAEGLYVLFCETLRARRHHPLYENMLLELAGTFQCAAEDTISSFHRQAWVKSFETFSLAD